MCYRKLKNIGFYKQSTTMSINHSIEYARHKSSVFTCQPNILHRLEEEIECVVCVCFGAFAPQSPRYQHRSNKCKYHNITLLYAFTFWIKLYCVYALMQFACVDLFLVLWMLVVPYINTHSTRRSKSS